MTYAHFPYNHRCKLVNNFSPRRKNDYNQVYIIFSYNFFKLIIYCVPGKPCAASRDKKICDRVTGSYSLLPCCCCRPRGSGCGYAQYTHTQYTLTHTITGGVACTGESHNVERRHESGAERAREERERERERERESERERDRMFIRLRGKTPIQVIYI